ncbi:MAG: creatininase family protein [Deltaproteobacteria bacterium]|nr:creatininase family protein [Deltaproteobacteria bacterium]
MLFSKLRAPEAHALIDRGAVALWPIGSTEAHGPHLPLDTDSTIASEASLGACHSIKARAGLEAVVLPTLAFGVADYAKSFRGTISIPRSTQEAYVSDVLIALAQQGFRAIVVVNGHVEPAHRFTLRDAAKRARSSTPCPIGIADPADRRFAQSLGEEFASGSCHAGRYESSIVMAADPTAVAEPLRQTLPRLDIDILAGARAGRITFAELGADQAYCGDPAAASRQEGELRLRALAEMVTQVACELVG